jgi:hypothetical protein
MVSNIPAPHDSSFKEADMKSMFLALLVAVLSVVAWPTAQAIAQEEKLARGTVSDIGGSWVTVKVRDEALKFSVDSKTRVEARGGSTKTHEAKLAGKPGPKITELLKVGQPVAVSYHDMAGSLHASKIQAIPSAGHDGGSIKAAPAEMTSMGTVKTVAADSITISGHSGGGGSFTQTFTIDPTTKVVGKGAGTATAAKGGRAPLSDLVSNGDKVSVSYHKMGDTLHASDVRVTVRHNGTR